MYARRPSRLSSIICDAPFSGPLFGCLPCDTIPPSRTLPVSFGLNGSLTSYCFRSPVPKHATYKNLSSRLRLRSVISGGTALNGLSAGGSTLSSAGSAGISITLRTFHSPFSRCQSQIHAHESVSLGRIVRRTQFEHQLILGAEVERFQMPPVAQIPDVNRVTVLVAEQELGHDAVFDHVRRAPFARDRDVPTEMPPEIVREPLLPAIDLPSPKH